MQSHEVTAQPAFTCRNLTIETLEQGVKLSKVNNKDTRPMPIDVFLVSLSLSFNLFHTLLQCFYC